jgi:hypothetical protein
MARQPREIMPASAEIESLDQPSGAEENAGSRRNFLQLGVITALGMAAGCGTSAPGGDDANAGSSGTNGGAGKGGTSTMGNGGTGAGAGGGAPMQGGSSGTGTGGSTSGSAGQATTGGAGPGAGRGGAGAPAAGAPAGGAPAGGAGGMNGGSPATGGAPVGGMSGAATGGSGGMGNTGMGGKEHNYMPLPALPDGTHGPSNKMLPDPFKYLDGTRISSKTDWERLRADLSAKLQAAVYGPKMPPPDTLKATFADGTVTVNMTVGTKTGSFTFKVSGGGSAGAKKPAIITCNASSLPIPSSVVSITLSTDTFAKQDKMIPTNGLVTTLYGNTAAKCGSDICWAWGASRMIDALEQVPEAGIDATRIGVTGCSYAGKGALAMGVFDERVALTIMQEGGSGGTAAWRISTKEASLGQMIQEATEIVGEQNWEGGDFKALFSGKSKNSAPVDMLIADQHFAVALAAPRGILLIENDIDWLGPLAAYGGGKAGAEVYKALGIADRVGISVAANHGHCSMPSSQNADLTKFINRFLLNMPTDTSGVDLLNATNSMIKTWKPADWIDWDTPTLGGALPWDPWA